MSEFGTSATFGIEIPQSELRGARQEIEDELGDITVSVDAQASGSVSTVADGGGMVELLDEQNDNLEDILDEIESGGFGGGGGAPSGDSFFPTPGGDGGDSFVDKLIDGLVLREAAKGGGKGGLGALGLGGSIGLGALTGLGGVRALQELGATEAIKDKGEGVRDLPGGEIAGDAAPFIPGLGLGLADTGAVALDLAQGDFDFSNTQALAEERADTIGNVADFIGGGVSGAADAVTPSGDGTPQAPTKTTQSELAQSDETQFGDRPTQDELAPVDDFADIDFSGPQPGPDMDALDQSGTGADIGAVADFVGGTLSSFGPGGAALGAGLDASRQDSTRQSMANIISGGASAFGGPGLGTVLETGLNNGRQQQRAETESQDNSGPDVTVEVTNRVENQLDTQNLRREVEQATSSLQSDIVDEVRRAVLRGIK